MGSKVPPRCIYCDRNCTHESQFITKTPGLLDVSVTQRKSSNYGIMSSEVMSLFWIRDTGEIVVLHRNPFARLVEFGSTASTDVRLLEYAAPVAQLDRALASGARGRAFESRRAYHSYVN